MYICDWSSDVCSSDLNNAILHLLPHSSAMGKNSLGVDCRRGHLSYSLFQDIKIVGKSLTGICQFIFPMFYGVLPNNIGYIFYGDKRNFLGTADKCLCIGFHIYYVSADVSQFCQEAIPRITSSILRPVPAITLDRKSTRLNSSHRCTSRMPSSA